MRAFAISLLILILSFTRPALADQTQIRDYDDARDIFWEELYVGGGESLYCGDRAMPGDRDFNIEHVYPASWMKEAAGCRGSRKDCRRSSDRFNRMEADLHNLYPSLSYYNSKRENYSFAILSEAEIGDCDFERNGKMRLVEPRPISRGNIARSILYMNREYGAAIAPPDRYDRTGDGDRLEELLIAWHCSDPVDDRERERNDRIEELQGNRNPFIDNPESVSCDNIASFPEN